MKDGIVRNKANGVVRVYSKDEDIFYAGGFGKPCKHSRELRNVDVLIDFDKNDDIVGIEIWGFVKALTDSQKEIDEILNKYDCRYNVRINISTS